jgi:hypothetical protein
MNIAIINSNLEIDPSIHDKIKLHSKSYLESQLEIVDQTQLKEVIPSLSSTITLLNEISDPFIHKPFFMNGDSLIEVEPTLQTSYISKGGEAILNTRSKILSNISLAPVTFLNLHHLENAQDQESILTSLIT